VIAGTRAVKNKPSIKKHLRERLSPLSDVKHKVLYIILATIILVMTLGKFYISGGLPNSAQINQSQITWKLMD